MWIDKQRCIVTNFRHGGVVRDNNRDARRHCLQRWQAETFRERWKAKYVSHRVKGAKFFISNRPCKNDSLPDVLFRTQMIDRRFFPTAVTSYYQGNVLIIYCR